MEKEYFGYYQTVATVIVKDALVAYCKKNTTPTENTESMQQKLQLLQNEIAILEKNFS